MTDDISPFVFPDLPDETAVAIDQFLEAFYHHFQHHYGLQLYRSYHALDEREGCQHPTLSRPPLNDPPF